MYINSIFDGIIFALTLFAVFSQIYLFFIVIFKSPPSMKEYRYFLCCFTFWDCVFTVSCGIFLMPEILPSSASFGGVINGLAADLSNLFGYKAIKFTFSVVIWGGADILQLQDYCLIYRYSVIQQNIERHQKFMSYQSFIIFHIIGYGICFAVAIPAYFILADEKDISNLLSSTDLEIISNNSVIILLDKNSIILTPLLYSIMVGFIFHECLSIFLATSIIKTLRANSSSFSAKTYKLHLQLTVILIIQLILPVVIIIIPATVLFISILDGQKISAMIIKIWIALITIYPASNSIITIIFVTPFWNFTKKWMAFPLRKIGIISPNAISTIAARANSPRTNVSITINGREMGKIIN